MKSIKHFSMKWNSNQRMHSLSRKLIIATFITTLITLLLVSVMYYVIMEVNNRQLHRQISSTITLSAENLNQNLESIRQFSHIIVVDKEVQNLLSNAKDLADYRAISEANSGLSNIINIYFDQLQEFGVDYVKLYGFDVYAGTYYPREKEIPAEVTERLLNLAEANLGKFTIVTDYSSTYGIFLLHSLRRVESASFDHIGTFILCINPKDILELSFPDAINFTDMQYALLDQLNNEIFISSGIRSTVKIDLPSYFQDSSFSTPYTFVKIDTSRYMQVGHRLFGGWKLFALLPYNEIHRVNRAVRTYSALFILAIGLQAVLLSYLFLKKRLSKPIADLVTRMEHFGTSAVNTATPWAPYRDRRDEIGFLYRKFDEMSFNIEKLIEDNYKSELQRKESQLQYLQSQINPHFLYNTLDSINWRAKHLKDTAISQIVESLAILLRGSLSKKKYFTLKEELTLAGEYLKIQQIKFGSLLSCTIECPKHHLRYEFPHMVLQPILENAILYSMENSGDVCEIILRGREVEADYILEVRNTGSHFEEEFPVAQPLERMETHGFGIGLSNIHQRIQLSYGSRYGLNLFNDGRFAVVEIRIPLIVREE